MIEKKYNKVLIVLVLAVVSIIGFMMKLPREFRSIDKELHFLFYFFAAVVINYLFVKRKFVYHIAVFFALFSAGVLIEYAQEFSNYLVVNKIHGNFDIVDVFFNTVGLVLYSFIWIMWRSFIALFNL
jgi:VanZ family protein